MYINLGSNFWTKSFKLIFWILGNYDIHPFDDTLQTSAEFWIRNFPNSNYWSFYNFSNSNYLYFSLSSRSISNFSSLYSLILITFISLYDLILIIFISIYCSLRSGSSLKITFKCVCANASSRRNQTLFQWFEWLS